MSPPRVMLILQDLAAKHLRCCKQLSDDQFAVLAGAVLEAVVGVRALEHSAAATIGSKESEAGIALLLVEAAKGGISGEDLEVRTFLLFFLVFSNFVIDNLHFHHLHTAHPHLSVPPNCSPHIRRC